MRETSDGRRHLLITDKMLNYMERSDKIDFTAAVGDKFYFGSTDITEEVITKLKYTNAAVYVDFADIGSDGSSVITKSENGEIVDKNTI